ncbi:MAG: T9SS type A sorting domain-containing protein, partial [Bacteroidia bacterium]
SLDLTISKVSDVSVSKSANMLTANNPRATYQWLDCNKGYIPITGETGQTFTTFEMGDYAVELSEDNCKDTSECYQIEIESVVEIEGQSYMVYPNPSKGNYTLDIGLVRDQVTVRILTVAGREIQKQSYSGVQLIDIKLTEPAGIYILNVKESNGKESSIRLIKQE